MGSLATGDTSVGSEYVFSGRCYPHAGALPLSEVSGFLPFFRFQVGITRIPYSRFRTKFIQSQCFPCYCPVSPVAPSHALKEGPSPRALKSYPTADADQSSRVESVELCMVR